MTTRFDGQIGAFAYLIFVLLYFPCISATSAIAKEISVRWSVFSMIWTTGLAYGLAVMFYQGFQLNKTPESALLWILGIFFGFWIGLKSIFKLVPKPAKRLPTPIRIF
jgi:ferrous iron transport protein B